MVFWQFIALLRVYYKKPEIVKALVECGFQMVRWDVHDGFSTVQNLIPAAECLLEENTESFGEVLEYMTFAESKYFEKGVEKLIPILFRYLPVEKTEHQSNVFLGALAGCMVDLAHTRAVATREVVEYIEGHHGASAIAASGRIAMEPAVSAYMEGEGAVDWVYELLGEREQSTDTVTGGCMVLARNVCVLDKGTMKGVDYDSYTPTAAEVRKCQKCLKELTPLLKRHIRRSDYVSNIYLVLNFVIRLIPEECKAAGLVPLSSLAMASCADDPHVLMNVSSFLCAISEVAMPEMLGMPAILKTVLKGIAEHQKKYPEAVFYAHRTYRHLFFFSESDRYFLRSIRLWSDVVSLKVYVNH